MTSYAPTPREQEVLALLVAGHDAAEIADALALSVHTVRHALARLRRVYAVGSTVALVAFVWRGRHAKAVGELRACERALAVLDRRGRAT